MGKAERGSQHRAPPFSNPSPVPPYTKEACCRPSASLSLSCASVSVNALLFSRTPPASLLGDDWALLSGARQSLSPTVTWIHSTTFTPHPAVLASHWVGEMWSPCGSKSPTQFLYRRAGKSGAGQAAKSLGGRSCPRTLLTDTTT